MNEKMEKSRDAALSILKPSRKDMEHGLELHKDSIVCDAYGFAPNAAVDGDTICKAIEAGAFENELRDLVEEMSMTRHVFDQAEQEEFKQAWDAAGVTCILQNAGEDGPAVACIIKRFARFTYVVDIMRDFLQRATVPDDIVKAKKLGLHCLYLSTNGVPLAQQWNTVEEELQYIRVFFQLGCRMMHLTYNRRNMIGDGCAEESDGGLSDFGRAVVREMNRVGVIVDTAHSSWQTTLEAAQISERPIVISHATCFSLHKHCRAKSDEVIRAIADSGGYIGICCLPAFLGGSGGIDSLLNHIEYVTKKFGADHVAIGTDTAYVSSNAEKENAKIPKLRKLRDRWYFFWPENDLRFDPQWNQKKQLLSLSWTNWPLFTVGLVQRGYSDTDIRKIIGGNVLQVARAVIEPK